MAEIYLVRHGQASFNSDDYDRLSDLGRQQSVLLGTYFSDRNIHFDHLFTGSMLRHKQTAEGILGKNTLNDTTLPGLNEYDFSALYEAFMAQHPEEVTASRKGDRRIFYDRLKRALKLWSEDKLEGNLPETWNAFKSRVSKALTHISDNATGKCLVVSSGGAISMAIGHILDLTPQKIIDLNLQIKNASFSHFYLGKGDFHLSSFNNIPHLDQPDRSHAITYS